MERRLEDANQGVSAPPAGGAGRPVTPSGGGSTGSVTPSGGGAARHVKPPAARRSLAAAVLTCCLLAACGGQPPPEEPGEPTERVITVNTDRTDTGGPECTLRDAIAAANSDVPVGGCPAGEGADVIVLPDGASFLLSEVDNETDGPNALPSITGEVVLRGAGSSVARAPGAGPLRLFHVQQGGSLGLEDLTVADGFARDHDGGAVYVAGGRLAATDVGFDGNRVGEGRWGGAVFSAAGSVSLERVVMRFNSAPGDRESDSGPVPASGSAVANVGGRLTVVGGELSFNGAYLSGERGVVAATGFDAYTEIEDTVIVDNDALGVYNEGELRLVRVEVTRSANIVTGGVMNEGVAFLDEVTLARNDAEVASGLSNTGFMRARDVTVTGHVTVDGFTGVFNDGIMELIDSEVSDNEGPPNPSFGGGVTNLGRLTLVGTSVVGNSAVHGGGIRNEGELVLIGSVVDANEAELGGGVYDLGTVELLGGSVVGGDVGNVASSRGGGVYVADGPGAERLVLADGSAVRGNRSALEGGGVYSEAEVELGLCQTCAVEGNVAESGAGGGIFAPGLGFGSIFAPGIRDNQPDDLAPGVLISLPIVAGTDDAEENAGSAPSRPGGTVAVSDARLELRADPDLGTDQHVGLRFQGVPVPPGASLVDARVVFTSAAAGEGDAAVLVGVQDAPAADPFAAGEATFGISSRPTLGTTHWAIAPWPEADAAGPAQATPSLRNQLQNLIDQAGWAAGNPVAVVLSPAEGDAGAGRAAHAYDGDPAKAPRLWLLYYEPAPAEPPPDEPPPDEPPDEPEPD